MKRLFVILSIVFVATGLMAQTSENDFVKTSKKTTFFKKVKCENDALIGVKANGETVTFKKGEVVAYLQKGKYYQKMPVYLDNVMTGKEDLMKVVKSEKGMTLFEYAYKNEAGKKDKRYFVFNETSYVVEMNEKNEGTLMSYFE